MYLNFNIYHSSEHFEPEKEAPADKKDKKGAKTDADKKTEAEKKEKEKAASESTPDLSSQQAVAVIGLALIAMGEDIGSEMLFRYIYKNPKRGRG